MRLFAKIPWLLTTALLTAAPAISGDWPQFHGPGRDNISTETGLLKRWPERGPQLLWTARGLGHGFSSLAVKAGRIYTAGNIGDHTVVSALDLAGKTQWQTRCGGAWKGPYPGTRGTPTLDDGRLYYETPLGDVVCLDTASGRKLWGLNILSEFKAKNINWGLAESLLIDGDRLICCPGGSAGGVVALDKRTGQAIWRCTTGDRAGYASPVLAEYKGLRIILTLTLKAMIGVEADSGTLLWRVEHLSYADENVLRPIYHDGHVLVSTVAAGTRKWKINVESKTASVEEVWKSKQMDNHHGGVVLLDGRLYGSSCAFNRDKWICLDWQSGKPLYVAGGVGKGSLTVADGMLYILGERGTMGLVAPSPATHAVVSRFDPPKGGEGLWWAHPVVSDGRLYVRHGEFLYAYDVRAGKSASGDAAPADAGPAGRRYIAQGEKTGSYWPTKGWRTCRPEAVGMDSGKLAAAMEYAATPAYDTEGVVVIRDGYTATAWGLHATVRDFAKLGYLYLHKGRWEDRQIVSEEWVAQSTRTDPSVRMWNAYGYLWHVNLPVRLGARGSTIPADGYMADGVLGQNIVVIPSRKLVIVRVADQRDSRLDLARFLTMVLDSIAGDEPPGWRIGWAASLPDIDLAACEVLRKRMETGRPCGSPEFVTGPEALLGRARAPRPPGPPTARAEGHEKRQASSPLPFGPF